MASLLGRELAYKLRQLHLAKAVVQLSLSKVTALGLSKMHFLMLDGASFEKSQ